MPVVVLACFVGGMGAATPSFATLYKWTDASGRVVYSDQPPIGDFKVDTVSGPPPPANPNALKELATKEAESKKKRLDAQESAKKSDQERADADRRLGVCKDVQSQMKQLASSDQVALLKYNDKGEVVNMDDAERRRKRLELENWYRSNCPA